MQRNLEDWQHDYNATPNMYNINSNEAHSTYDQFIQLRDTLIFTGKYYNNKASRKLCVWDKWDGSTTNTIEVRLPNIYKQSFQPGWATDPTKVTTWILWKYVTNPDSTIPVELITAAWPLCCMITKDWHYRLIHKEEVIMESTQNKCCCYIDIYRKVNGVRTLPYKGWVAVFDEEGWTADNHTHYKNSFPFSWSISWTCHWEWWWSVTWTCSWNVTIQFTLWEIIHKITAFGYQERDLKKWDFLVLRTKDLWPDDNTGEPQGNNLTLQRDSNYWSIEYLDLSYNI